MAVAKESENKCPKSAVVVTWKHLAAILLFIIAVLGLFGAAPASSDRVKAIEIDVSEVKEKVGTVELKLETYGTKIDLYHKEQMDAIQSISSTKEK